MASTTSHQGHDAADGIVRPRPLKPGNPGVLRAQGENGGHRAALGKLDMPGSGMSRYAILTATTKDILIVY